MLKHSKDILPQPNTLPVTYRQLTSLIRKELISVNKYSVCVNDCVIFRDNLMVETHCPKCGEAKLKESNCGKKFSRRRFTYCPLKSALELLFGCSNIAKVMQQNSYTSMKIVTDVTETKKWLEWTQTTEKDNAKLVLSLNTDGMNPFHSQGVNYSCWPLILTILNLPKHLRNRAEALILVGVVPSKNPRLGKGIEPNLNIYAELLVEELIQLADTQLFSAYQSAPINVKVNLLMYMMDFQGYAKFFSMSGCQAYMNCNICLMKSTRRYNKMVLLHHSKYDEVQHRNFQAEVRKARNELFCCSTATKFISEYNQK